MHLFGKKKTATPKDTIIKLRETVEMLDKREKYLEQKIQNELKIAKANATKNKRVALMAIKRKKQFENDIQKLSGAKMNIETQLNAMENASVNLEAMNAMRMGASAMKQIHGSMDINQVDNTMDDIREQLDLANEISDAIGSNTLGTAFDEDELMEELEALQQEELDNQLLDVEPPGLSKLPSVPTSVPVHAPPRPGKVAVLDDEDAELAELRASMAM